MRQDKVFAREFDEFDESSSEQSDRIQDHLTIRLNVGVGAPHPSESDATQSTNKNAVTIASLPNHILSHIFSYLDLVPPSQTKAQQRPFVFYTFSRFKYLKNISLVSTRWRGVCIPLLYRHCRLDIDDLALFLHFTNRYNLRSVIHSVTVLYDASSPPKRWWDELLSALKIARLTIHADPKAIGELAGIDVSTREEWGFDMPYQILTLQQSTEIAVQPTSLEDSRQTLLHCKPWHTLTFNEGSSLSAYLAPESARDNVPSLLTALCKPTQPFTRPRFTGSHRLEQPNFSEVFSHITTFHYIAIFPFSNHITKLLKCLQKMNHLHKLYIKLCPDLHLRNDSTAQEIAAARILNYVDSVWEELEKSYTAIAHAVEKMYMEKSLVRFCTGDMDGVGTNGELMDDQLMRSTVSNCLFNGFAHLQGWQFMGFGVWRKVYA